MKVQILIFSVLLLLLNSCSKDFLEIYPKTDLTSVTYFKTQSDFEAAINGCYAPLRSLYKMAYMIDEMHSDNTRYFYNPNMRAVIDQEKLADFIIEASNSQITTYYRTNYLTIARANQVLYPIDKVEFENAAVKANIKGQALFLRAFSYFNLVQHFGDVPLHLLPATNYDETFLPLTEASVIYDQIIADVTTSIDLLPVKSAQDDLGRVTKGAAQMLLANIYMVQKNYGGAETILLDIIDSDEYDLMTNYADIYELANKNSIESVFEIQFKDGSDGYASSFFWDWLPCPVSATTLMSMPGVTNATSKSGEGFNCPTPDIIAAYEAGDLRKDASIGYLVNDNGTTAPYCKKFFHAMTLDAVSGDDFPVYRYSEVLLFLAEAINEQNRPLEALTYINDVVGSTVSIRGRAGLGSISATTQTDVRDAIAHERQVEFLYENKRWPDLVRTGKAVEVITAYGARVKANPLDYYFTVGSTPPSASYLTIDLLLPLPAAEAAVNPYF